MSVGMKGAWGIVWPGLVALLVLASFHAVGVRYAGDFSLDLGSLRFPRPGMLRFMAVWTFFSALASIPLGLCLARLSSRLSGSVASKGEVVDRFVLVLGAGMAFLVPLAIRFLVLDNGPLTDDESAYRFMGELLASGRLSVESPEHPEFFSRGFMINDGRLYSQYFVGWPALLAVGEWFGAAAAMNAVCASLTAVAAFRVAQRLAGSAVARWVLLVYVTSPMSMIAAATDLSHTSCVMALAWMTWFSLRTGGGDARARDFAGVAIAFGLAFFIRPLAALGVGAPFLVVVAARLLGPLGSRTNLLAFAAPALALAGMFFAVNHIQNGSWWTTSYQQMVSYSEESSYLYSGMSRGFMLAGGDVPAPSWDWDRALANTGNGLFRLNIALFGWPFFLLFAVLSIGMKESRILWASFGSFLLFHLFLDHAGIDSFGPVYFMELSWPVLILSGLGLAEATRRLGSGFPDSVLSRLPVGILMAFVAVSTVGYVPIRLGALEKISERTTSPRDTVGALAVGRVVVFAQRPFVASCMGPRGHVLWRPNNDPDLENDVLWVNHLDVQRDQALMKSFPGRTGYVMLWTRDCRVELLALSELEAGDVPPGYVGPNKTWPPICADPWLCWAGEQLTVETACANEGAEADEKLARGDRVFEANFSWVSEHPRVQRFLDIQRVGDSDHTRLGVRGLTSRSVLLDLDERYRWKLVSATDGRRRSAGWLEFESPNCT
ncbi:glycosyltransferase family 39 protein [Myxococcota bacterium]|nr:glycosyltransferase family 39 protein [Myxococcota bacterium]